MTPEAFGRLATKVEHLEGKTASHEQKISDVMKWQWQAIGFLAALTLLTQVLFAWSQLKGH